MTNEQKYLCPVCGKNYNTSNKAQQCVKDNGSPKIKYEIGMRIITQPANRKEQTIGTIIKISITQPVNPGEIKVRQPHTVLYLIRVEAIGKMVINDPFIRTTAAQEEIQKISQQKHE